MTAESTFGLEVLRYLDELSDRNLVWIYRHELTLIGGGHRAHLTHCSRRRLKLRGIMVRGMPAVWALTEKGEEILESLDEKPLSLQA